MQTWSNDSHRHEFVTAAASVLAHDLTATFLSRGLACRIRHLGELLDTSTVGSMVAERNIRVQFIFPRSTSAAGSTWLRHVCDGGTLFLFVSSLESLRQLNRYVFQKPKCGYHVTLSISFCCSAAELGFKKRSDFERRSVTRRNTECCRST